jgi:hypothetical protein
VYLLPFIVSGIGLLIALLSKRREAVDFAFINVGGLGFVYVLDEIQSGDSRWLLWNGLAILIAFDVLNRTNRFFDLPNNRREQREAKLWRQLFGHESFLELLLNDPRRKTWRLRNS